MDNPTPPSRLSSPHTDHSVGMSLTVNPPSTLTKHSTTAHLPSRRTALSPHTGPHSGVLLPHTPTPTPPPDTPQAPSSAITFLSYYLSHAESTPPTPSPLIQAPLGLLGPIHPPLTVSHPPTPQPRDPKHPSLTPCSPRTPPHGAPSPTTLTGEAPTPLLYMPPHTHPAETPLNT